MSMQIPFLLMMMMRSLCQI